MSVNHMRQVVMSLTHPVIVRWKDGHKDIDVPIRFKAKSHAQVDTRQHCRIGFEKTGIYLYKIDEQVHTFHFTMGDVNADPAVRRLWNHEMLEQGYVVDHENQREPMSIGRPAFTAVTKMHNRPKIINRNDTALWLLQRFCMITQYHLSSISWLLLISAAFGTQSRVLSTLLHGLLKKQPTTSTIQ